jgi:hypothetical protein
MMAAGSFLGHFHPADKGRLAAEYAIDAANASSPAFAHLSAEVCTAAVRLCLKNSGAIAENQYLLLKTMTTQSFSVFVRNNDPKVKNAAEMLSVPQGSILAFIDEHSGHSGDRWSLVHAMIAVSHGWAAGNKNSCIGIGDDFGWQLLDLATRLSWTTEGEIQQMANGTRRLTLRFRRLPL